MLFLHAGVFRKCYYNVCGKNIALFHKLGMMASERFSTCWHTCISMVVFVKHPGNPYIFVTVQRASEKHRLVTANARALL